MTQTLKYPKIQNIGKNISGEVTKSEVQTRIPHTTSVCTTTQLNCKLRPCLNLKHSTLYTVRHLHQFTTLSVTVMHALLPRPPTRTWHQVGKVRFILKNESFIYLARVFHSSGGRVVWNEEGGGLVHVIDHAVLHCVLVQRQKSQDVSYSRTLVSKLAGTASRILVVVQGVLDWNDFSKPTIKKIILSFPKEFDILCDIEYNINNECHNQ